MIATKKRPSELLGEIGDLRLIDRDLQSFRKSARLLSSQQPNLVHKFPKQWIAVYRGRVRAHANSLKSVLKQIYEKHLPSESTILRFIDKKRRTMIL